MLFLPHAYHGSGCWDCCRDFIPKQVSKKDPKTTLLNGNLRSWIDLKGIGVVLRHNPWKMVYQVACHLNGDPFPRRSVASATTICPLCCAKQTPGPPGVLGLLWALFGQLEFASLGFLH